MRIPAKNIGTISLLGLMHGFSDCISGYLIGTLDSGNDLLHTGMLILLYNLLAFGGQLPAGMIVDNKSKPKIFILGSALLVIVGFFFGGINPILAIVLAGVGSAFFHVSGGMVALTGAPGKASGAGIFAAPGVIGLATGGYLAIIGFEMAWLIPLGLAALTATLLFTRIEEVKPLKTSTKTKGLICMIS